MGAALLLLVIPIKLLGNPPGDYGVDGSCIDKGLTGMLLSVNEFLIIALTQMWPTLNSP